MSGQSDDSTGFNALSRAFKANPTIENYVKLRQDNPEAEIEVAVTGGIDWLFANDQLLQDHGVDPGLFASVLDASPTAISQISLVLLTRLVERNRMEAAGLTQLASRGKAIPDSLVNYLIAIMLDSLSWNDDLEIPRDLIVLTRHQLLGSDDPALTKRQRSHELEKSIVSIGAQLLESGASISTRIIAEILGINASTVSRMFPGDALQSRASEFLGGMRSITRSDTPFADIISKRVKENDGQE